MQSDTTVMLWNQCQFQKQTKRQLLSYTVYFTFILEARLTIVKCFNLFFWVAVNSGRLSLFAVNVKKTRFRNFLQELYNPGYKTSGSLHHTKPWKAKLLQLLWVLVSRESCCCCLQISTPRERQEKLKNKLAIPFFASLVSLVLELEHNSHLHEWCPAKTVGQCFIALTSWQNKVFPLCWSGCKYCWFYFSEEL